MRLAVVTSHPILCQIPIWRTLARHPDVEVKVFYATNPGIRPYDAGFGGIRVKWDVPLLGGYNHEILENRPLEWLNWRFRYRCPGIRQVLREGDFDSLLVVGKEFAYYLDAMRTARKLGVPILYRAVTPQPKSASMSRVLAAWHRRRVYSHVSAFLCVGQTQYDFYGRYGIPREKMFWSPYCVDNSFFRAEAEKWGARRDETRRELGFGPETRVVAFAGKFIPVKRPLDLVEAFARLAERERYGLLFVGDGPLKGDIEGLSARHGLSNVALAGFRNQTEIGAMYAAADCLVLPSAHETWGLVVNEAMNFGLPVIVSDQVGCGPDLVRPGQNGYVPPKGDVEALARAIERVFASEDRRRQMGERSLAIVEGYSVAAAVKGIVKAFQHVASE